MIMIMIIMIMIMILLLINIMSIAILVIMIIVIMKIIIATQRGHSLSFYLSFSYDDSFLVLSLFESFFFCALSTSARAAEAKAKMGLGPNDQWGGHPQLIFIHLHQLFRVLYTLWLDTVNIYWWWCINLCRVGQDQYAQYDQYGQMQPQEPGRALI